MWVPWRRGGVAALRELSAWGRARAGYVPVAKPTHPRLRWSLLGVTEEQVERLAELRGSAERLQALMDAPGWKELLEAKLYYQGLYDRKTKNPDLPEAMRFRAACEWAALEGFFLELHARVKRGRQAEQQLRRVVQR